MKIKEAEIKWAECWRIIPSVYPPIQLFERDIIEKPYCK